MAVCTQPLTYAFCGSSSFTPNRALSVVPTRSRSALFRQTWHTRPRQRPLCGLPPFQVCAFSTDLAHLPLVELPPWPATVPGLHLFDRPGTPVPVRDRSRACHRSRSALFRQTWHTRPRQRPLRGLPPFQVCAFSTDLAHLPLVELPPWPATVPGLHLFDRPGTPVPVRDRSRACHRSRSAPFRQTWNG